MIMSQRVLIGGWLAVAAGVALAACARQEEPAPAGLEAVDPTGQTVTFWYQHAQEREAALLKLIDRFNQSNPYGIKVIGEHAGSYDEIYSKMLLRMQSGGLPDLVVAYPYQAQAYYRNHASVDIQPYMNSPSWGLSADERSDYFQEFLEQDRVQDAQIADRESYISESAPCFPGYGGHFVPHHHSGKLHDGGVGRFHHADDK